MEKMSVVTTVLLGVAPTVVALGIAWYGLYWLGYLAERIAPGIAWQEYPEDKIQRALNGMLLLALLSAGCLGVGGILYLVGSYVLEVLTST